MEMMGEIRRMVFRDELSRNTIQKWVKMLEATQPVYQMRSLQEISSFNALEQALKADSFRAKRSLTQIKT